MESRDESKVERLRNGVGLRFSCSRLSQISPSAFPHSADSSRRRPCLESLGDERQAAVGLSALQGLQRDVRIDLCRALGRHVAREPAGQQHRDRDDHQADRVEHRQVG